jgi:hypothetical protein
MTDTFIITSSYKIKYTNKDPVPIDEIISSLRSIERIIKRTPKFIEKRYEGIEIIDTEVFVTSIESGSLKEDILIKYIFKTKENYDASTQLIEKICEDNHVITRLVVVSVAALVGFGVALAVQGNSTPTTQINAYNSIVINESSHIGLGEADIKSVLDEMPNKPALIKDALKVIKPAHLDENATIEMGENEELKISSEFVAKTPEFYEPPMPSEKSEKYRNVEIFIHATDRDHSDKGWAGIVYGVTESRTKFVLSDGISPQLLHGKVKARVDVVVNKIYVPSKKSYKIRDVEILNIL